MKAIINGRVLTGTGQVYPKGMVLVDGGLITAVGADVAVPEGAQIIDADGCWVTPGLIDPHTHIGVLCEPQTRGGIGDSNETAGDPATPHVRALDAFYPFDPGVEAARRAGFTTCCTLPGSANIVGGTGFAYKTAPRETVDQMMIPGTQVMKLALGENPRFNYGTKGKNPKTRMGIGGILRQILFDAKNYSDALQRAEASPEKAPPKPDFKLEALVPVMRRQMKCRIHCHRADDIATAIRIAEEFELDYALEHVTEGFMMPEALARRDIFCVIGPLALGPAKQEIWERNMQTPALLEKAGVKICLTQDSGTMTKLLPSYIGMCIARGLDYAAALEAVTIRAARLLGIGDVTGSVEVGKAADIAIFTGDPFSNYSLCRQVMIDGELYDC